MIHLAYQIGKIFFNFVKALDLDFNSETEKESRKCLMDYFGLCIKCVTEGITSDQALRNKKNNNKIKCNSAQARPKTWYILASQSENIG